MLDAFEACLVKGFFSGDFIEEWVVFLFNFSPNIVLITFRFKTKIPKM